MGIFSCSKEVGLVHLKDEDEIGGLIERISEKLTLLYGRLLPYISTTYHRREITCFILKLVNFATDVLSLEAVMDAVLLRMVRPTAWKHERPKFQAGANLKRFGALSSGLAEVLPFNPTEGSDGKGAVQFAPFSFRNRVVKEEML